MNDDIFGLRGKTALIVGGGQGIGEQTALRFAGAGCNVGIVDLVQERAAEVAAKCEALGVTAIPFSGDVLDSEQVASLVADADDRLGGIDVLVSIIGSAGWSSLIDMPVEMWDREQAINLKHVFLLFRETAKTMIHRGRPGAMACVASVSGVQSAPNHGAYGAAKAGLIHLVRTMAVEWADAGIRVNSVAPGSIITPRVPETPERSEDLRRSRVPLKRRGTTDEIAKGILFLSSDMASYITGQNLMVDGGWTAANLKNRAGVVGP